MAERPTIIDFVEKYSRKFENNPEDFQYITDKIDAELYGLFPAE